MKILVSVCLVALFFCLGVAWWVHTDKPSVDGMVDAVRNDVNPGVTATRRIRSGWPSPPRWIPADAERDNDHGAFLTWIATDAERRNDQGAFLTWIATDVELDNDQGPFLTWTATDAERDDDIGVPIRGSGLSTATAFRGRG